MSAAPPPGPRALAKILGVPPPTPEQARIIAHPLTPLLVVAGAGSGKTATMSQRVVHLVVRGEVRPDQVLGLTFTRRATAELDQRVAARLARLAGSGLVRLDEEAGAAIATYNAFAGFKGLDSAFNQVSASYLIDSVHNTFCFCLDKINLLGEYSRIGITLSLQKV